MTKIIAEIGFNHEGNLALAIEMIKAIAKAGAHAVKFQTYRASDLALPSAPHYQAIQCGEMTLDQHKELAQVSRDCGLDFLSTPFSSWAVDILEEVGVPAYKVASMDCTNKYLLGFLAETKKPIYLSTGMATLDEIASTLNFLNEKRSGEVTLLHCMSLYPPKADDLNLNIIPFLKTVFGIPVGYSDHYPGIKACVAAVMLGAEVIETHFTIDTKKEGADHHHSVDPDMLKQLITEVELFDKLKGNPNAIYSRPDRHFVNDFRRGVYSARQLKKSETIKEEDMLFCRPTSELSPDDIDWFNGKMLSKDVPAYTAISREILND